MTYRTMIDVQDVRYAVDGRDILRGVSLQTDARRIGILGRNGSGKTSLARAMTGLIAVDGRVRIAGVDVAKDRRGALGAVGLMFQNPDHQIIFPTVEEELAFGLGQQGLGRVARADAVQGILKRFGRADWATRAVHDLSHGQKQLVCLMAILAMAPKVIVLDEPLAGLDIPTRMRLARVLAGLDATLIHITHDPADLDRYDRIVWLEAGEVAKAGGAEVREAYVARMRVLGAEED